MSDGGRSPLDVASRRCLLLFGVVGGLWVLSAGPAWWLAGRDGLLGMSLAAVLCFVPGIVVFLLAARVVPGDSKMAAVVLVGTGLRMATVLAGVLFVRELKPAWGLREFLGWILAFYLTTLATETAVLLRRSKPASV